MIVSAVLCSFLIIDDIRQNDFSISCCVFLCFSFPLEKKKKITFELNKNNPQEKNLRYHFFCFTSFPTLSYNKREKKSREAERVKERNKRVFPYLRGVESIIYIFIDFLWFFFNAISGEIISSILFILLFSLRLLFIIFHVIFCALFSTAALLGFHATFDNDRNYSTC